MDHYFPVNGEYLISAVLSRNTVEVIRGMEETHEMEFLIDGESIFRASVGGAEDTAAIEENPAAARVVIENRIKIQIKIAAGPKEIGVTFIQANHAMSDKLLQPFIRTTLDPVREDGLPHLENIVITGPFKSNSAGSTLSREKIFSCHPDKGVAKNKCALQILSSLAQLAYRRPVDSSDMQPLMRLFNAGNEQEGFEQGIEQAIRLIISNPNFVFRFERDPASLTAGDIYQLGDLELASRLSFFIWSSIPDEELLDIAIAGNLTNHKILIQQVDRMLADKKAFSLVENFAAQWLHLRNLKGFVPNPKSFPDFDDNLRQSLLKETQLFFNSIIQEDRSVMDLLSADYTYVNERLARHYGIPGIYGSRFRKVNLPEERRGLLGQGSILTVTSYATRTSPVLRGKWILTNILDTPPPAPPADIPDLKEVSNEGKQLSVREQMVQHRVKPSCASCHKMMDPLGLALDNFDAIGKWRDTGETGNPIDASGQLIDGTYIDGPASLREALLSRPNVFVTTLTTKLLTYALGRGTTYRDAPVIRHIVRGSEKDGYRFSSLIKGIVVSTPFQMKAKAAVMGHNEGIIAQRPTRDSSSKHFRGESR